MAPKHHPTPLSGGDRKALTKELGKARAMANILAAQSVATRAKGEALIQQADKLLLLMRTAAIENPLLANDRYFVQQIF